jgi:alpha-amylase
MLGLARCAAVLVLSFAWAHLAPADDAAMLFDGLRPARPDPALSLRTSADDWYKDAVVYHLWVAAFRDSNGDNIGDLAGVTRSLDTLKDLGVTCLWLSPFFKSSSSPRNLHGYDVVDHYTVDPRLGTNDDARTLIREAHARNIRLIVDFVPNHLSTLHPWFVEARADRKSPKRDWFVFRDGRPERGWTGFDNRSDWYPVGDGSFYYAIFFGGMPDVNHRNPAVRLELAKAARHWLDLGFDGLRIDAVKYLYENLDGDGAKSDQEDRPETLAWFESFRRDVLDPYTPAGYAKFMVAENWTNDRASLLKYVGTPDRPAFHMTLNFPMLPGFTKLDGKVARDLWAWDARFPKHAWLGTFASNHDLAADRPGSLFADRPDKLRAQAAWLLLGPGTPFVYYGNEVGQPQGTERGDTKQRKPLDWVAVARQRDDPKSIWRWHRQLIRLRAEHASIRRGKARFLDTGHDRVLALYREHDGEATLTIFNAQDAAVDGFVHIDVPFGTRQFILGEAKSQPNPGDMLNVGPLLPYETKVVVCPRR